jgi:hypothetical protein
MAATLASDNNQGKAQGPLKNTTNTTVGFYMFIVCCMLVFVFYLHPAGSLQPPASSDSK